ncbi:MULTISPECIES: UbiA family prenyltransferase [Reichenbachiella]|uniref:UbiA family prenyltransferase n=1 Tax=Reichenbachiella TaxID=156993 RepID=UPI000E6CE7F3|nr:MULTISPECIES: UbiA family prenyltransferase [Reichenbachiella]MBU2914789.1 UbiA family prenyltransferase [Reichenbachiella agariperforans]RJE71184.1 hypothetical protein BGP76_08505 [Reichenbachiella sp. MSK19-1]
MGRLIAVLKWLTWLSIDIGLGAVVLTNSIAYLFGVDMDGSISVALFVCVWLIYTLDHLLDAKKLKKEPSMERHAFHYRNASWIFSAWIIIAVFSLFLVFFLPTTTLLYGVVVAGLVGVYIMLAWWLRVFVAKEFLIAVLYAVGVFIGPLSSGLSLELRPTIVFVELALLALINLMLFSMYEQEKDAKDGFSSWATIFGSSQLRSILKLALLSLTIVWGYGLTLGDDMRWLPFQLIIGAMGVFLAWLYWKRDFFHANKSYRVIGDAVFFFPVLIFLL